MRWIKEHKLITTLIIVLLVASIMLISALSTNGKGNPLINGVASIFSAIEKPFISMSNSVSEGVGNIFSSDNLAKQNEQLKNENEQLKEKLSESVLSQSELKDLKELSKALNYGFAGERKLVTADVISYDGVNWTNIFTINAGTKSGIKENDVVVYGGGLVGRVSAVGDNWSKVISLIDDSSKVSFDVSRNDKLLGVVTGTTGGKLEGYMLDQDSNVAEGDKILTTGMGIYPKGVEIGTITEVKYDSDSKLKRINVEPAVQLKGIQKVSVIL